MKKLMYENREGKLTKRLDLENFVSSSSVLEEIEDRPDIAECRVCSRGIVLFSRSLLTDF